MLLLVSLFLLVIEAPKALPLVLLPQVLELNAVIVLGSTAEHASSANLGLHLALEALPLLHLLHVKDYDLLLRVGSSLDPRLRVDYVGEVNQCLSALLCKLLFLSNEDHAEGLK